MTATKLDPNSYVRVLCLASKADFLAGSAAIHDDLNSKRRVKGPSLQDVAGPVPSRGGTYGVVSKAGM
jgi:hypothetical protein